MHTDLFNAGKITYGTWVWPILDGIQAAYSDRFFHILPDDAVKVSVETDRDMDLEEFNRRLQLFSLTDTSM